jgi:hypothetical protein
MLAKTVNPNWPKVKAGEANDRSSYHRFSPSTGSHVSEDDSGNGSSEANLLVYGPVRGGRRAGASRAGCGFVAA